MVASAMRFAAGLITVLALTACTNTPAADDGTNSTTSSETDEPAETETSESESESETESETGDTEDPPPGNPSNLPDECQ
jgi:hypothetical protein